MNVQAVSASINELATFAVVEVNSLVSELAHCGDGEVTDGSTGLFTLCALHLESSSKPEQSDPANT